MSTQKTICTVCNYIYDEALGDSSQQVPPAIKFEHLPEQWNCPECNSGKDMFQPCSCVSLSVYEQTCVAHHADLRSKAETNAINKTSSVGQLVAQRPMLACVLEQYGIDYCCGGKISLEEACRKKGLNVAELMEKLIAADSKPQSTERDWTIASLKDLINHIINTYHQPLRQELTRVAPLAEKVARVHGDNHPEMVELLHIFNRFKAQLELHMQKEEMVLFPGIASIEASGTPQIFGCGGGIEHPIEVMSQEHDDAGEAMCTMRRLANDYIPPEDACNSFKVLLSSLAQIESEMHQHVHKENNILFPRALALHNKVLVSK